MSDPKARPKCLNCCNIFSKRGGHVRRISMQRIVNKSRELKSVLSELMNISVEHLTPKSNSKPSKLHFGECSICHVCFSLVERMEKRKAEIELRVKNVEVLKEEFLSRTSGYLLLQRKRKFDKCQFEDDQEVEDVPQTPPLLSKKPKLTDTASAADNTLGLTISSPETDERPSSPKKKKLIRWSFSRAAANYVTSAQYGKAFSLLLRNSDTARRQFMQVLNGMVRKEMMQYTKMSQYTSQRLSIETLESFSWKRYLRETRQNLPVIHSVIDTAVTTRCTTDSVKVADDGTVGALVPGIGHVIGLMIHLRHRQRFRLVQGIISTQLYRSECSEKLQTWFQKVGLSLGVTATKTIIDRLALSYHKDVKCRIEALTNPEMREMSPSDTPESEISLLKKDEILLEESSAESDNFDEELVSEEDHEESDKADGLDLDDSLAELEVDYEEPLQGISESDSEDSDSEQTTSQEITQTEFGSGHEHPTSSSKLNAPAEKPG